MASIKLILLLMPLAMNWSQECLAIDFDSADDGELLDSKPMVTSYLGIEELLHTETVLIDTIRDYIAKVEKNLHLIKSRVLEIKEINEEAMNNTDLYINNPINAVMILKRFKNDWKTLQNIANKTLSTERLLENIKRNTESLRFPEEEDFDDAVGNLLRLSDLYNLQPQLISSGEINGIKFGSEMSWSDCLEIGRKSDENGDYKVAKYWIETALDKLPTAAAAMTTSTTVAATTTTTTATTAESNFIRNSTENEFMQHTPRVSDNLNDEVVRRIEAEKARFEILQALLNIEFHMGNFKEAVSISDEMLKLKPLHKGVMSAREVILKKLNEELEALQPKKGKASKPKRDSKKKDKKQKKSVEQLLVEEICRDSTTTTKASEGSGERKFCYRQHANLPELLLQPAYVEVVSLDPFIAIHHNVLTDTEATELSNLVESSDVDEDDDDHFEPRFTDLGRQHLIALNKKLQSLIGHSQQLIGEWKPQFYSFEDNAPFDETSLTLDTTSQQMKIFANVLLSLHSAKLGGLIVFPQLELSIQLPSTSLLYWSNLNEYQEVDYRTKQYFCPVIAGSQLVAFSTIRRV